MINTMTPIQVLQSQALLNFGGLMQSHKHLHVTIYLYIYYNRYNRYNIRAFIVEKIEINEYKLKDKL